MSFDSSILKIKKYTVFHDFWADVAFTLASNHDDSSSRTKKLREFFPESFLKNISPTDFKTFACRQRSDVIKHIEDCMPLIIGNLTLARRQALNGIQRSRLSYRMFCPILYEDHIEEEENLFLSTELIQVVIALLHGQREVQSTDSTVTATTLTYAEMFQLESVLPATIAMGAVLLRFALSEDKQLERTGRHSSIEYELCYLEYSKTLEENPRLVLDWNKMFRKLLECHNPRLLDRLVYEDAGDELQDELRKALIREILDE